MILVIACVVLALLLFIYILAWWKLYAKLDNGHGGWKSIIPIYNEYYLFKKTWRIRYFILKIVLSIILGGLLASVTANNMTLSLSELLQIGLSSSMMIPIAIVSCLIVIVEILQLWHVSKSFGHSVGYTLGLIFLDVIFVLIIGLGSSKYQGNSTFLKIKEK